MLLRAYAGAPGPSSSPRGRPRARRAAAPRPVTPAPASEAASEAPRERVIDVREYRRNVGVCLVNSEGLVFCARRVDDKEGTWQMPQGGIDHLENPLAAAARELREETGIVSARVVAISGAWEAYDAPTRVKAEGPLAPSVASSDSDDGAVGGDGATTWLRYRGQTQKWVLMYFYGDEAQEVDLGPPGAREFSEYAWRPLPDVASNVVPFKRPVYERVAAEFGPVIAARRRRGACDAPWWGRSCV